MSTLFFLKQSQPIIYSSNIVAITGEEIILSGSEFKNAITRVYGESIFDSNINFDIFGEPSKNLNGINNLLFQDSVGIKIPTGIQKTKYNLYVYNSAGQSTNSIQLHVLDSPTIQGIETYESLPDRFVRITGSNFYPSPEASFINYNNVITKIPIQNTGFYRITGYEISNFGTGYQVNEQILIDQKFHKLLSGTTFGRLQITTTGVSGSLATLNILDSGIFTIIQENPIVLNTSLGREAEINLLYDKFISDNLPEIIEFQVPRNVTKYQKIFIENLKYKVGNDIEFYSKGFKDLFENITGFDVLGIPKIHNVTPLTGYNTESRISLSGDNLNYVTGIKFGRLNRIPFNYNLPELFFKIPYLGETSKVEIFSEFGYDISEQFVTVSYREIIPSGYSPNDILLTGTFVNISGKNLQRINYINLGQQNITRDKISVVNIPNTESDTATFSIPDSYKTNELRIYSLDFPNSGILINSQETNDKLIASAPLNIDFINLRYLSGIQAAKYLDEVEVFTPSGSSGDYGNLTNSEIFFTTPTGNINSKDSYIISGIKIENSATGIKFLIPREIKNPRSPIKIRRNKFGEEYILPLNKSVDVLPSIHYITPSNTNYTSMGTLIVSGINASNANQILFSGYQGTTNIFGFKNIRTIEGEILEKNVSGILRPKEEQTYTEFEVAIGGDIVGSGEAFLFNDYYDTGIGYENHIITKDRNIRISPISGFRPTNSPIFTSPGYIYGPIDTPFIYNIQTNSKATQFEIFPTTLSGVSGADAIFPPGLEAQINSSNQIVGVPTSGGVYYLKIRAIDGDYPDEAMILNLALGYSGRSLVGPGIVYRGDWDTGISYAGNALRRDIVKYSNGANYWYAANTNIDSTPSPSNPDWIPFTNEMSAAATQLFLAERSTITTELNIGRFGIFSGYIKSVNDIDVNEGSGFYLGYDHVYNVGKPVFRVGNSGNYIKFDGLGLDIIGPLSGIVTTSKDIFASSNRVSSKFSVALGQGNTIADLSDNALACGTSNTISGAIRGTILGGSNNLIKKVTAFNSYDSAIAGGTNNLVVGSFSCIAGGKGNIIDSSQSGLAGIAGQLVTTFISGSDAGTSGSQSILYPSRFFTDRYSVISNLESLDNKNGYYISNIQGVADSGVRMTLNTGVIFPDDINIHTWSSITVDNLFENSFNNDAINPICEFKVIRTGIEGGNLQYNIPFRSAFTNNLDQDDIIALVNIHATGFDGNVINEYNLYGLSRSGLNINFPFVLETSYWLNIFVGETGFFTGLQKNFGKTLQAGKVKYFENPCPGSGASFSLGPLQITGLMFTNVNQNTSDNFYLSNVITGNNPPLVNLSKEISPEDEFLTMDYLGFNRHSSAGASASTFINTSNFKVFRAFIPSGTLRTSPVGETFSRRFIVLPSSFTNANYSILINRSDLTGASGEYYGYSIREKQIGGFWIDFSQDLQKDLTIHILGIGSGTHTFDGITYSTDIQIISGYNFENSNIHQIQYPSGVGKPELVFVSLENTKDVTQANNFNFYDPIINNLYTNNFDIKLSRRLNSGESAKINIITIDKTGRGASSIAAKATLYEDESIFTGQLVANFPSGFDNQYRVFTRAFADLNLISQDLRYNNIPTVITSRDSNRFKFRFSGAIPIKELANLRVDYVASDLDFDRNIELLDLVDYAYSRLAVPFDDAGSNMIAGGTGNLIKGVVSAIAGGTRNSIYGDFNSIVGGRSNTIIDFIPQEDNYSRVLFCNTLGGLNNTITGNIQYSTILGGSGNKLENDDYIKMIGSSIVGGTKNYVRGSYSICAGNSVTVDNYGTIYFSDSTSGEKRSNRNDACILHFANGVYLTGYTSGSSPLILDVKCLPTGKHQVSEGGVYRSGEFLAIRIN